MAKKVYEGEVIDETVIITRSSKNNSDFNRPIVQPSWTTLALFLLSLVPIVGLLVSVVAILVMRARNRSLLVPITTLIISLFVTGTFLVLRFIVQVIF